MTNPTPATIKTAIGVTHGYRFDGDFVHLNAEVNFSDADLAAGQSWALQLWASDQGFKANQTSGVKVAELGVQPMAGGLATAGWCTAMPPAGTAEQVLALALVSFAADGSPLVRDLAIYPSRECFSQPALTGTVSCTVGTDSARLVIEKIANPRGPENISGTLALEVWALDAPYNGGSWTGQPVATVILGILAGGDAWTECAFEVPAALPEKAAALTVMLREWTPAGYVTRDFRNFAAPAQALPEAAKVPAAKSSAKAKSAPKAASSKPKAASKASEPATPAKQSKAVSVNKGSEDELTAIKGLSRKQAQAIIAARPFATLDEVSKVKGLGAKSLEKLKAFLAL